MNNDYQVEIQITNDQGQVLKIKPKAIVDSCFWKDIKLHLFAKGSNPALVWSCVQFGDLIQGKPTNPDYGRVEGLREQFELPATMVSDFKEALGCYIHSYYDASVVMSRKLLERTLIARGAKPHQRICDMVNDLSSRDIIDHRLRGLCDDIKYLGNIGAHANEEEANKPDAEQALHFTDFLISWLFGKVEECD